MCSSSCIEFGTSHISREEIKGKRVLEVGSLNINGSLRSFICNYEPLNYLGVDLVSGSGVDAICDMNDLTDRYGRESFDVVICTEVVEHVRDWRKAVSSLKNVLKLGGIMILTTRSKGFPHHSFPYDFWRFETDDINAIFDDMIIEANEKDPDIPGVFIKVRRPATPVVFVENNLDHIELYSVIRRMRCRDIDDFSLVCHKTRYTARRLLSRILPDKVKAFIKENIPAGRGKS